VENGLGIGGLGRGGGAISDGIAVVWVGLWGHVLDVIGLSF
jgi:hypothetical protein